MRKNLPVSNNEYALGDDVMIVSKTDIKGKLTYFNEEFVRASGFSEAELINQPHNIVRHPDMPPEAYADLWNTLKEGKPWAGAVKNRRKNGDFYWVLASATPIWENGQVTGYMSIRSKLPADQRREAEQVYAILREGKAQAWRVDVALIPPPLIVRSSRPVHPHAQGASDHPDRGAVGVCRDHGRDRIAGYTEQQRQDEIDL